MSKRTSSSSSSAGVPGGNTGSRLTSLKARRKRGHVECAECDSALLVGVLDRVIETGALISFSRTSDGGAISVYIKDGADEDKVYVTNEEELTQLLHELYEEYE